MSLLAPCSLTRLYTVDWPTSSFHFHIPKNDNGKCQNVRWIIPFKKFGMVRVNIINVKLTEDQVNLIKKYLLTFYKIWQDILWFMWQRYFISIGKKEEKSLTSTWFEHATFWSGVRRATVAPRSHIIMYFHK